MSGPLRGLLLPLLFIVAGLVALLVNVGLLPLDTMLRLLELWPLVLVVLGVEIVLRSGNAGRTGRWVTVFFLAVAVIGSVLFVSLAPAVGDRILDRSQSIGSTTVGSLVIEVGAAEIRVHGEALGDTLYRVHAIYSGHPPVVHFDPGTGALRIEDSSGGLNALGGNRKRLDITLNDSLPWTIEDGSGASRSTFDLSRVKLSGLVVSGGANQVTATLPQPSGRVSIEISGGASSVKLSRPGGVIVGVNVSGGATSVEVDGRHLGGFGSNQGYRPSGFDSASDRYEVSVSGGASSVRIGNT